MDARESGTRLRTRSTKNMCESPLENVLEEHAGRGKVVTVSRKCIVCRRRLLLQHFPSAMIVVRAAERLEREVAALERALEYDGVRVRMVWAKDAVRDILVMAAWDERVREGIWKEIGSWVREAS